MAKKTKESFGDSAAILQDKFSHRAKRGVLREDDANSYAEGGKVRGGGAAKKGLKTEIA